VSRLRLGLSREYFDCSLAVNGENDRETDGYTAVDYIRAIVGTLNSQYQKQPYGLGGMTTMYPASAFITHMVYLRGTTVKVDVKLITSTLGVKCLEVGHDLEVGREPDLVPKFDGACVRRAIEEIEKLD